MKKKSLSNRSEIISILLILMVAFSLILKVISNDLFFDLKTGESILKHGVDFKDHFSFIPNLTYIYHHWFYDLIVLGIYKYFRWHGLFILFLLMYSLFGISLFFVNKNYSNKFIATIVAIYTMIITAYAFQFRVQSISYLLFFWEVCILEKLYKTGNKKYSFFLVIISIIIVNIHMPLWILCLILFLPYLVESLLCLISKKHTSLECMMFLEQPKNTKLLIITFFILVFNNSR